MRKGTMYLWAWALAVGPGAVDAQETADACAALAVRGVVADLLTGSPLPGSIVTVQEPAIDVPQLVGRAVAGAGGAFTVCVDAVGSEWEAFAQLDTLQSRTVSVPPDGTLDTLYIAGSEPARVVGRVYAQGSGEAVEGARVTLRNRRVRALTDGDGRFEVRGVGAGAVVVETSFIGYATRVDTVLATSGGLIDLQISLGGEAVELEPIVVTARRAPSTRARPVRSLGMTAEQVAEALPSSIDVVTLLRRANIPGLLIRSSGPDGVCVEFLRGSGGCTMVAVYVNGLRISSPSLWLTTADPSMIEEFFVLRPAFAQFQYMDAANGVLDITLK